MNPYINVQYAYEDQWLLFYAEEVYLINISSCENKDFLNIQGQNLHNDVL